jgi:DNA ligase (NAD+)
MNKITEIKNLTEELLQYCHEYYDLDSPTISDIEYDRKFDELEQLENEANFWLSNSPTKKVQGQVLEGFQKVTHSKPMLSAAKTKDINEIKRFIGNNDFYCSYKLDGLTLVCIYDNGEFKQAITRGTGLIGEDVTKQARMIGNLPMSIPYNRHLEIRGECVVSWETFYKINQDIDEPYSHPRNLAAGSLRNLDTNITKQRNLSYVVFECVSDLYDEDTNDGEWDSKWEQLSYLSHLGFETVERMSDNSQSDDTIECMVENMTPDSYDYPVDGLIFELNSASYSKSLEATSHHECCRMALKWADSTYETVLRDVVWDVGRSGVISPVAVFDEVDLDGALTTRATLHNLSIIESLELGIGDTITVYRSNMVIPKIDDNLTRSNTLVIPGICPCCGAKAKVKYTDNSKFLMCTNPNCSAKLLAKFTHFVSRNCMNIDGLSEATLEVLINNGWTKNFKDIYYLYQHGREWEQLDGFGEKSVAKILDAIDRSRKVKLENFICALSIDGVGKSASKTISEAFNGNFDQFIEAFRGMYDWSKLTDIGDITAKNINKYLAENEEEICELAKEFDFETPEKVEVKKNPFIDKTICVTGKLEHFNRDSINAKITGLGAKVASGVTAKTDFLLTNTPDSGSSKNVNAKKFGTKIITEQEFLDFIGE